MQLFRKLLRREETKFYFIIHSIVRSTGNFSPSPPLSKKENKEIVVENVKVQGL